MNSQIQQVPLNQSTRDAFDRTFAELKSRNDESRKKAAQDLRQLLEATQRDAPTPEYFQDAYRIAIQRASALVVSGADTTERIGGIYALSALMDFKGDDGGARSVRFANCLRTVLRGTDTLAMVVAAQALGKLAIPGSPLTAELVDSEVKAALESLQVDRQENRRFAAVLTIRELAHNAPTLLYQYVAEILEVIWVALRDPKVLIRETTAQAISELIGIIAERDLYFRDKWFTRIYNELMRGLANGTIDTVHGSLLASKELLIKGGMFIQNGSRYQEICEKVYYYKDHREPPIRREVTTLIPILAAYHPTDFSHHWLHKFMIHLQGQLKRERDRGAAFIAIGKVATAVGSAIDAYLDGILVFIREGLGMKAQNKAFDDAPIFQCISMIAIAVGQTMTKYRSALLDPIFECGLSEPLTQALVDMAHYVPPVREEIQRKLADALSVVLTGRPFAQYKNVDYQRQIPGMPPTHNDEPNPVDTNAEIALALQTLGSFDFSGWELNMFVHDVVVQYTDNDNAAIRKAAALTCAQLLVHDPIINQVSRHAVQVVGRVVERLLAVAIADTEPDIRHAVLRSLNHRFDRYLAKGQNTRTLFIALNDEVFSNRQAAIIIIGRLSTVNPAYVFPSLRKVLVQLLTEIEYSNQPRSKQESAQLICDLINASSRLMKPYVDPMIQVLLPKADDMDDNVAATAMKAIGDLATIGGESMVKYIDDLMDLVIRNLQNLTSNAKRSASLKTLGQLASNAGYVIEPYLDHPELLPLLINIVKVEPPGALRSETIRLIGILGALDPYKHQQVVEASPEFNQSSDSNTIADTSFMMGGLTPSNDEYFPTTVFMTLMNLLKDQSLTQLHQQVIEAVMNIYTSMGLKCVPYLSQVIPGFLSVIHSSSSAARIEGYFSQLAGLVKIVRQHIRPFLKEILDTVQTFWTEAPQAHATILQLVEAIARSLEGEFKVYLARVLPLMLGVLDDDDSPKRTVSAERVLHAFLVFGSSAEEYMHLIIPVILRMVERRGLPLSIRKSAIETLGKMSRHVNISEFAACIVHPLVRLLGGPDVPLKKDALDTISALIFQLGSDFIPFIHTVNKVLISNRVPHANYAAIVSKLQKGEPLPQNLSPDENYVDNEDDQRLTEISTKVLAVNQMHLKSAWIADARSTKEDWVEWMRRISIELLKESPQQTLRACSQLASVHQPTARALFNSAFISCYTHLFPQFQEELVKHMESALTSNNIPPEILQTLLNLAEFMEHDDKALPIDVRHLGQYAGKCHAYAKSLHYKELQFNQEQTPEVVEALISINNALHQTDAAFGILRKAQSFEQVDLRETWFEKLNKWDEALESYNSRETEKFSLSITMGKMRCLHALGEWEKLAQLAEDKWSRVAMAGEQRIIAPLAAAAAWGLQAWEQMDKYLDAMKPESPDRSFFGAILSIHREQFAEAQIHIDRARTGLDTELGALFGESYDRAYNVIVRVQMLAELEEVMTYKQSEDYPDRQETMRRTWAKRLKGCQRNVDTWQRMLKVRNLVVNADENMEMLIKFANLCRKSQREGLAKKTLLKLSGDEHMDLFSVPLDKNIPNQVGFAALKFLWDFGNDQERVFEDLQEFTGRLSTDMQEKMRELASEGGAVQQVNGMNGVNGTHAMMNFDGGSSFDGTTRQQPTKQLAEWQKLLARCHMKQGQWQTLLQRGNWANENAEDILKSYETATHYAPDWYKAWHAWALANFEVVTSITSAADRETAEISKEVVMNHVVPAIQGFFKSVALTSQSSLQDALRLLTLWFAHGRYPEVIQAVTEGIATVSVDIWLEVIPQLIARINQPNRRVQHSIHNLLVDIGRAHPQALVYPLTVSMKSDVQTRSLKAAKVMDSLQLHSPVLVEQANTVSHELIRIAVLWHEQWHEGLEEASRMYFGDANVEGMLAVLEPLHRMLDAGPETLREVSFIQSFGRDLNEAQEWCQRWKRDQDVGHINQAWDVYYTVFKRIVRQLPQLMTLELQYVSPNLKQAKSLNLAVPGTYKSHKPVVCIDSFDPVSTVINSKQRPRKLTLRGSDGKTYTYLLKGHEDIRQDERVMQLFGLVNTLLKNDPNCLKRHLNIQTYSAIPLSTQSGLLGWVPDSDTIHALIKDYRESRKILLNIEHRIMLQMAPDYDGLALMQKVEVFSYAMDNTTGQDLYRVLWLKSKSSESWLERRTSYIRSLGVMSMVGYILGLGDRHPSNLMLDRITGKIIHIDFGDCFEVAQHRDKYPERVPFRLTRMLTFAMEVSNIEGSFRTVCENVMRVLRGNKESLMAVLEAFIHDPLLTWRLTKRESPVEPSFHSERRASIIGPEANTRDAVDVVRVGSLAGRARGRSSVSGIRPPHLTGGGPGAGTADKAANLHVAAKEVQGRQQDDTEPNVAKEVQNARALQVLARVKEKLTGTDFSRREFENDEVEEVPGERRASIGYAGGLNEDLHDMGRRASVAAAAAVPEEEELGVEEQVEKLISEATNLENLCQHYVGWCSFW